MRRIVIGFGSRCDRGSLGRGRYHRTFPENGHPRVIVSRRDADDEGLEEPPRSEVRRALRRGPEGLAKQAQCLP